MNFGLEWHQEELQRTAREFLSKVCHIDNLRAAEASEIGFSLDAYREMGKLGWLQIGLSGNEDEDFVDQLLLYEEFGRAALPGPHFMSAVLAGQLLASLGGPRQRPAVDQLGAGERIATVAIYEESAGYDAAAVELRAEQSGDRFVLRGSKMFVPFANSADDLLVLARTGEMDEQLTFFFLPAGTDGLELLPLETLSGERHFEVRFHDAAAGRKDMLGGLHSGWSAFQELLPLANVLQAAELVGLADAALELAVEYAKQRTAFGRAIGSFQAIQHKCAEMVTERDSARFLTYQAACFVKAGDLHRPEVAYAKAFAAAAARRVTKEAHQILGGAGFMMTNRLNYYYRRAKAIELSLGDTNEQLETVARALDL